MQEAEKKLVRDSFSSVAPYLAYPQELRGLIERALGEGVSVEAFIEGLRQTISAEADTARKTDGQIFLNELRRRLPSKIPIGLSFGAGIDIEGTHDAR
jgi:uncharacterized membrane protein